MSPCIKKIPQCEDIEFWCIHIYLTPVLFPSDCGSCPFMEFTVMALLLNMAAWFLSLYNHWKVAH